MFHSICILFKKTLPSLIAKIFSFAFFQKFYRFYLQAYGSFRVNFYVWCVIKVNINFFPFVYPVVEKTILSLFNCLGIFVINQLNMYRCGSVSGLSLFSPVNVYVCLFANTKLFWYCSIRVSPEIR